MKVGRNNDRDVQTYVRNSPLCDGMLLLGWVLSFSARKMMRTTNDKSTYDVSKTIDRDYTDDESSQVKSSQVEWLVNVRRDWNR